MSKCATCVRPMQDCSVCKATEAIREFLRVDGYPCPLVLNCHKCQRHTVSEPRHMHGCTSLCPEALTTFVKLGDKRYLPLIPYAKEYEENV